MQVMGVRHVGVGVPDRLMAMPVAVFARWHGVMCVQVMAVVMGVGMFMFQRLVVVDVGMRLRKMQYDANHHE